MNKSSFSESATQVLCFGEILWDGLPDGFFLGGAPFNVAHHLRCQEISSSLISAVGDDFPGRDAIRRAAEHGVDCQFVKVWGDLETGNVCATLDEKGNATYEIARPVAWDRIEVGSAVLEAAITAKVLVYGSLAARSEYNQASLRALLAVEGPSRMMDVNLRAPYDNSEVVLDFARRADFLKLNDQELEVLAPSGTDLVSRCEALSELTCCGEICVTLGAEGALYWHLGRIVRAGAPPVTVVDTIGAGDAFMAALVRAKALDCINCDNGGWLEAACRTGAYVAARRGATPVYSLSDLAG